MLFVSCYCWRSFVCLIHWRLIDILLLVHLSSLRKNPYHILSTMAEDDAGTTGTSAESPSDSTSSSTATTAASENESSSNVNNNIININNSNSNEYSAAQTRFRFYEPQELVSEENNTQKEEETKNNHSRFSFYDDTTRQELAAVENIHKQQQQQQSKKSATPAPSSSSDDGTDEILRSLQETEVQRLQILKTDPTTTTTTTTTATPRVTVVGGDENGSNPYEDAIKEALDLLRKHRSPPSTPAVESSTAVAVAASMPPTMVNVTASASASAPTVMTIVTTGKDNGHNDNINIVSSVDAIERARTPREHDHLLKHRMDQQDDEDGDSVVVTHHHHLTTTGTGILPPAAISTLPTSPLEDLTDAYEEHKLKAKQRQERMAQYASRLQEFKSSLPAETMEQHWPPNNLTPNSRDQYHSENQQHHGMDQHHQHAALPHAASHDSIGFSDISHSTKEHVEAEVQRGVERVLLAILERASSSRGRASAQEGSSSVASSGRHYHQLADQDTALASTGSAVGDALIRAMDELGLKNANSNTTSSSTSEEHHNIASHNLNTKTSGETEGTGMGSKRSATSVVDELLAEDEDDDILEGDYNMDSSPSMPTPKDSSTHGRIGGQTWGGPKEEKKLPDSQEKVRLKLSAYGTIEENDEDDVDRLMEECLRSQSDELVDREGPSQNNNDSHDLGHRKGVLGPLSKRAGGTTGVVLDIDVDVANGVAKERTNSKATRYKGPFSNAMESDDDDSFDRNFKAREDKYTTVEDTQEVHTTADDQEVSDEADDSQDFEAKELMRTLCAHFLPFGVDQKYNELIESIPDWDESNPNEAGYRIIRLSRTQLQRVELAFENMVNGLKQKSERQLGEESGDAKFVRELREVERLLDESEEKGLKAADTAKAQKEGSLDKSSGASNPAVAASSASERPDLSFDEDCHPHFPGIKTTGKGEMGDLEYFHLPIIFKSHVTGFEPTKDLVLEPGNVMAGQYLVESELGSAAFSTAYRCIDLSSEGEDGHEEVCLKVIKNTKDFFDQSLDEIKILELLRQTGKVHENHIVEMKCFFYYREHLVIVTELLRQNLFEFGKFILDNNEEPYFTITRLAYITRQALISLRFVHSLGLVHSDVKPENMLLSSYSRAQMKLIDFGSSCYLTDRQSSYIQSRSYRAPEVVLGLPYDGRIDVWSLGCVVAEMFTGEVTFQNDSIVSMLCRIEAICGPFPRHMIAQGRQSGRFFTKSGLLYEVVDDSEAGEGNKNAPGPHDDEDDDDYNGTMQFDIFQPKHTRLCARLGFDADLMDDFDLETYTMKRVSPERRHQQLFTDFVRRLLTVDPDGRPTADEALNHPWMQYAATLTEEEVKYPSS